MGQLHQETLVSLERQLDQNQHVIEPLLYHPTILKMHTNGNEAKMSMEITKVTVNDSRRGLGVKNNALVGLGNAFIASQMTNNGLKQSTNCPGIN